MTEQERSMGDLMDILDTLDDHERDFVNHHWINRVDQLSEWQAHYLDELWHRRIRKTNQTRP